MPYFDYAATSMPKPKRVTDAVVHAMNHFANPSRGAHDAAVDALRCLLMARQEISEYFGVGNPMRVSFCGNATMALNIAIASVKGHVVTTSAEHNSVLRPLYRRGNFTVVPVDAKGRLNYDALFAAVQPDTDAIVMTSASNVTGNGYNLAKVGAFCREQKLHFIVDAAQGAGLLPIDMQAMGISALCFSGHKSLYGPQGTGGLCLADHFIPYQMLVGGSGSHSFSETHPAEMPEALEAGTQNVHGIAGLLEAVRYVKENGSHLAETANRLAQRFIEGVQGAAGIVLYGDLENTLRTPVVSLNFDGIDSAQLARQLGETYHIAVRAGAHCAPLMHKSMGTQDTGAVRFSFSHFNTDDEIDQAVQALLELRKKQ